MILLLTCNPSGRVNLTPSMYERRLRDMFTRSTEAREHRVYTDAQMGSIIALLGPNLRLPRADIVEGVEAFGGLYKALVKKKFAADTPAKIVQQLNAMAAALERFEQAEGRLAVAAVQHLDVEDQHRAARIIDELPWLHEALLRAASLEKQGGLPDRRDHAPANIMMHGVYQQLAKLYAQSIPNGPDGIRSLKMPTKDVDGQYQGHVIDFFEACITSLPRCAGTSRTGIAKRFIRMVLQRKP